MDINKYKGKKLHENPSINFRIEAIFLLYDKQCEDLKLNFKQKIKLINNFIDKLILHEEYEIAKAFKDRKFIKFKKWRRDRRDYTPGLCYRFLKFKIKNLFK